MPDTPSSSLVRYLFYEDLHYIPEDQKNELWMAQCLVFAKKNNREVVSKEEAQKFKDIDEGKIDANVYKLIFDPKDDSGGGKAEHVATDWKANPIYVHLNNIVEASLEKIPFNIFCKAVDEYAKTKQQKDNERILRRREFFNLINDINKQMGYPLLKETDDPFKYAKQMQKALEQKDSKAQAFSDVGDSPTGIVDMIKSAISDNEDIALYNEFVYKGDVEIGIELGIKYYLNENKYEREYEQAVTDIRNHNKAVMRYYTNTTNGAPMLEYLQPDVVYVSPYRKKDGSDISSWFIEYDVTFRDFVRMFGFKLSNDQLKAVFDRNKLTQAGHGLEWSMCSHSQKDAAKIRIGYIEQETQNCNVYSEGEIRGNFAFRQMDINWQPSKHTANKYKTSRTERHYNVWYKAYYIPLNAYDNMVRDSDFQEQAKFIFEVGKLQDQQRYGDSQRLSRCSLIMWGSKKMSYAAIMDRFMPKIHFLWQSFQNDLANHMPHGLLFAEELVQLMMTTTDDANKTGKDSKLEFMRKLKQTGYGITKLKDGDGKLINDGKPFAEVKSGHLESAREKLVLIQEIYNMAKQAVGTSDIAEGLDPKPRQSLGGINLSLAANTKSNYFMEKACIDMNLEVQSRLLNYIILIAQEPDSDRFQRFRSVVGVANSMSVESLKDIPNHELGLYVDNVNTEEQKARLIGFAEELVKAQLLDIEVLQLIIKVDNYKYAAVLMIMKYKQKQKEIQAQREMEFQREMQLKQMDIEINKQNYMNKAQADGMVKQMQAKLEFEQEQWLAKWKSHAQQILKEMTKNNKITQDLTVMDAEQQQADRQKIVA